MAKTRSLEGRVTQSERPNWRPLEDLVGERVAQRFMWMYEVELGDRSALQV